ncbi:MAG: CHAT domain-containing tetratricopeptide repeat protein [Acidobacteriota bacterium]
MAQQVGLLGDYPQALELQEQVLSVRARTLGSEHPATLTAKLNVASTLHSLGDLSAARRLEEEVLRARSRSLGEEHPATLNANANLAATLRALGDLRGARHREEEVLASRLRLFGPEHLDTLTSRANLAATLGALGDLSGAHRHEREVLENFERLLGLEHPDTLTARANLAATLGALGELSAAREHEEEVLEARRRLLGEEHPDTLLARGNLAESLGALGELSKARQYEEEVLEVRRRLLGEEHPDTLTAKANLAATLSALGILPEARDRFLQVLQVRYRLLGSGHPDTLTAMSNLATIFSALGDHAVSRSLEEKVLESFSNLLGPQHPSTLTVTANFASTLLALGDLSGARERQEAVVSARRRILGEAHPDTLVAMHNLGTTLREAADLESSTLLFERLIQLRRGSLGHERRPSTLDEANSLFFLGSNRRDLGLHSPRDAELLAQSYVSFQTGLGALEAQTLRADFSQNVRARYKARYAGAYRDTLAVALELDRPDDALHVLERYRTQSLLTLLRWSRPGGEPKIPEEYRKELASNGARYDALTRLIDSAYPDIDPAHLEEQAQLRRRREVVQGKILDARRAEEDLPSPLRVEEIRRHLDPGTLMLAYSVGGEGNHLFVLDRDGLLDVHRIDTESWKLAAQVGDLRSIDRGTTDTPPEARRRQSQWLYDKLLASAAERIDEAERLLILPDGPLHYLHFGALIRPADDDPRGWRYLLEDLPVHTAQSATVYAELRARRRDPGSADERRWAWAGFGDPVYPVDARDVAQRSAVERKIFDGLEELPFTEREVREIAAQFSKGHATAHFERDATEGRAREVAGAARIVHFAVHGLADPDVPMDSFLALSLLGGDDPEREHNGLLQAWEIIDHLRLDADLVVLSACVTAFGPERGGEGLISLSRAFQVAGARSVLASLWAVHDTSTAELMIRFYRHLLAGQAKDEALRSAQLELIRGPIPVPDGNGGTEMRDFSAPYHWGAFQLIGDYR